MTLWRQYLLLYNYGDLYHLVAFCNQQKYK